MMDSHNGPHFFSVGFHFCLPLSQSVSCLAAGEHINVSIIFAWLSEIPTFVPWL
jgi:hypothetical protein